MFGSTLALAASALGQSALLWRGHDLARLPAVDLDDAVRRAIAGPSASERAAGFWTAVPAGTVLHELRREGDRARLVLSEHFLRASEDHGVERAVEQLTKTVLHGDPGLRAVDLVLRFADGSERALHELQAESGPPVRGVEPTQGPTIQSSVIGALSGRTIAISPGHGYYWHSSLGWTTQRGNIDGLIEDIHTNEIAMRYLIPMLEDMGARVISCRERGEITVDRLVDDDGGAPAFTTVGNWSQSASTGYDGGGYRFASTAPTAVERAQWQIPVPVDGRYPVYAWFRASSNRSDAARYLIHHSGGVATVDVDQTRDNLTWRHLGDFWFQAGTARIELSAEGPLGKVVIADTIRIGGGNGSLVRGSGPSGQARWREAARYWTQFAGAPSSVWNSVSTGQDNDDDVTSRPRFAEWLGADAYLSLHTNAGGGLGTSTYIYNGGATAGSTTFQARVHDQIVADLRANYRSTWTDRGKLQANFGEVRVLATMPGALVELAFHDTPGSVDHQALHDPVFRRLAGRAMARGILRYFNPTAPFPPEPPAALRVRQDGAGGLAVLWLGSSGAGGYSIEQSVDGKGFTEVAQTATTSWSTGPLPPGTALCFRVRAFNASGRSFPTEVLVGMTAHHTNAGDVLFVQGFDRLDRSVKLPANTGDYLPRWLRSFAALRAYALAIDSATNEAVQLGSVALGSYPAVAFALGEESTTHETFSSLEQSLVRSYVQAGGNLLVSGSEIAWDLEARGSPSDVAFLSQVLGVRYISDDAGSYVVRPRAGSIFAELPAGGFDNGTGPTYDVDFPDVVAPIDAFGRVALEYGNGLTAGVTRDDGTAKAVYLAFPLETILDDALRGRILAESLRFLLAPRALSVQPAALIGTTAALDLHAPLHAGSVYWLMASLWTEPAIVLPGGARLSLAPDGLFFATLDSSNALLSNFLGTLDAQGRASAGFLVPPIAQLRGLELFFAGIVFAPSSTSIAATLPYGKLEIR